MKTSQTFNDPVEERLKGLCLYTTRACRQHVNSYESLSTPQRTLYAVVPVHTKQEILLLKNFLKKHAVLLNTTNPKESIKFAELWNSEANGISIFYKSPEHLRHYSNILKDRNEYHDNIIKNYQLVSNARQLVQIQ
jgi:hypothetical protein